MGKIDLRSGEGGGHAVAGGGAAATPRHLGLGRSNRKKFNRHPIFQKSRYMRRVQFLPSGDPRRLPGWPSLPPSRKRDTLSLEQDQPREHEQVEHPVNLLIANEFVDPRGSQHVFREIEPTMRSGGL